MKSQNIAPRHCDALQNAIIWCNHYNIRSHNIRSHNFGCHNIRSHHFGRSAHQATKVRHIRTAPAGRLWVNPSTPPDGTFTIYTDLHPGGVYMFTYSSKHTYSVGCNQAVMWHSSIHELLMIMRKLFGSFKSNIGYFSDTATGRWK